MYHLIGPLLLKLAFVVSFVYPMEVLAQANDQLSITFSSSFASGWWIYTLGDGAGIDRTDNEPKISLEGTIIYKPKRVGIGLGIGYSFLNDNSMEAFEDTRAQRRKYAIAENSVRFWQVFVSGEYDVFTSTRYILSPQVRAGSFSIDTTHPEKDNFGSRFLLELGVVNQIGLAERWRLVIRPFYQVMMIPVKQETLPGERHRIFSLGLGLGLRYRL